MSKEQDVQEKRLNAMKYKILKAEQENLKTREKNTDQMVETIRPSSWMKQRKIIEVTGYAD